MKPENNQILDELHEECGVLGIYGVSNASHLAYYGLHALQHRGQQGCGIVSVTDGGELPRVKGGGLVIEVFNESNLAKLGGDMAIGHVRYANDVCKGVEHLQPLLFHHGTGDFAIANNGCIVNYKQLREYLEAKGSLFHSSTDAEVFAHLIKKEGNDQRRPRIEGIKDALKVIDGAFAFLIMTKNRIYAFRDKYGLRPLVLGKLNGGYVIASETCAFNVIGAEYIRDVEPGEILTIDHHGVRSQFYAQTERHAMCAMEYIYFSRPDSDIEGCNVHNYRKVSGKLLFGEAPADGDIVIGVPDSSLSAAQGYAEASGLPYEMGLIKNKYIGRTFIQPTQALREKGVKMKLSAVKSIVRGKRVVLVDDSIIRGTTSIKLVRMLREAGASEVHVRIASASLKYACYYGVDIRTPKELISAHHSTEEVCKIIGADSLAFLSHEGMLKAGKRSDMCIACFDNKYPTKIY